MNKLFNLEIITFKNINKVLKLVTYSLFRVVEYTLEYTVELLSILLSYRVVELLSILNNKFFTRKIFE